jgi:Uma2 family endonuclease
MGVMTVTDSFVHPFVHPQPGQPWTIDDLDGLPEEGGRYEIVDGSLLVSPHANIRHFGVAGMLRRLLDRQAPDDVFVGQDGGVQVKGGTSYFVPDVMVVRSAALERIDKSFLPTEVLLVVEVLSPSNSGRDLVLKRHYYAAGRIPRYWIVDPTARTLAVLELDGETYRESAVVAPGTSWKSDQPFPLTLDPADFL